MRGMVGVIVSIAPIVPRFEVVPVLARLMAGLQTSLIHLVGARTAEDRTHRKAGARHGRPDPAGHPGGRYVMA